MSLINILTWRILFLINVPMQKLVLGNGSNQIYLSPSFFVRSLSLPVLNIFSHVCILFLIKTGELYSYHCEHLFIYISLCLMNYFRICGAQETLQCIDKGYLDEVN